MRTLLIGGQACVFYGAAEFSRDVDLLVLADSQNLSKLSVALAELNAEVIAVPEFEARHLLRGHAIHFRCHRDDVAGLRLDIMSSLREAAPFEEMWDRRTVIEVEGQPIDLLSIEDLVQAKKTQRDKDWPMIRRLVEQSYFERFENPSRDAIRFWLREMRSPELLVQIAAAHPDQAASEAGSRPALAAACQPGAPLDAVADALDSEEREERRKDREYWAPLKHELEQIRLRRRRK